MKISVEAQAAAKILNQARTDKKIERRFSFLVIYNGGRPDHIKPYDGMDITLRIPLSTINGLQDLSDYGLIDFSDEAISSGRKYEVWLKSEFLKFAANAFPQ